MPPLIPGISYADALARFKLVGWRDAGQSGSHHYLVHPERPGIRIPLPDHRRRDVNPAILGEAVVMAGLTEEQFRQLTGARHRRNARRIRQKVYGMSN